MKKYVMDLIEAKKIYLVFFKKISQTKIKKMYELLRGYPKKSYLFPKKYSGYWSRKIDLRVSYCHFSRRTWSNGLNYARKKAGQKKLKIMLYFCYNDCGAKFLGYYNGRNQRQYCKKCSHNQYSIEDYDT